MYGELYVLSLGDVIERKSETKLKFRSNVNLDTKNPLVVGPCSKNLDFSQRNFVNIN